MAAGDGRGRGERTEKRLAVFALAALATMQMSGRHFSIARCDALRMINLDAPQMALEGDTIQLSCSYSLIDARPPWDSRRASAGLAPATNSREAPSSGDTSAGAGQQLEQVYVVKWYRDEREFFRFLTQDWPHKQAFAADGLNIDVEKSDNQSVVLRNVSLKAGGLFRCEVSTDAPSFLTKSIERKLLIYHLPNDNPSVSQLNRNANQQLHHLGDQVSFRCSSSDSKPAAQIDWIINDKLNLSEARDLLQDANGTPTFKAATRRIVRLVSPLGGQTSSRAFHLKPQRSSYVLETSSGEQQHSLAGAESLQRPSYKIRELHDPNLALALEMGNSTGDPISLAADSLHQLLETSISWLNLTVDANLLQYLTSGAPALPNRPPAGAAVSTLRTTQQIGTHANNLASPSRTSRGSAFSKSRRKSGGGGGDDLSQARQLGAQTANPTADDSRVSLRVRCVARVLHLSLSDDIRLKVVGKTRAQAAVQRSNESSARMDAALAQASNAGEWR